MKIEMKKKKLLLLGGSAQQIVAIEKAKSLGYDTVLCDYLPDNPGQRFADRFYLVSTTDRDAILQVAHQEQVDGVIAYASDPAAPTAAYVAEQLQLPTNPFWAVDILCNKGKFRKFLREHGFAVPMSLDVDNVQQAQGNLQKLRFPIIIKPVDSSGSKGVTVLSTSEGVEQAVRDALEFSRCGHVVLEEYVEKSHKYLIGGDLFVKDGRVCLWGLLNCHRDTRVNPLVPVGKSYPLQLEGQDLEKVRGTLQRLIDLLEFRNGAMNVELIVDARHQPYLIDVGPRNGGNMIPDLLDLIYGVDVIEASVQAAMGNPISMDPIPSGEIWATHNLHSRWDGKFEKIVFDSRLERYIVRKCIYKKTGDPVRYFDNAAKALGIIFMKFPTMEERDTILSQIEDLYTVQLT